MIKLNSLKKEYRSKKGRIVTALHGITLELPENGLIFVLGKSGSGKSTFLHLLGGLERPTDGDIIVDGKSIKNFTEKDFNSYRNEYVGYIFQEYNLIEQYSVGSNIALSLELQKKKAEREEIDALLRELGLIDEHGETLYDRKINELSNEQKQRVAIARALMKQPKLILADEPAGALDSEMGKNFYRLLKKYSQEKLIVVVTNDREIAEQFADRIIELEDGQINSDSGEIATQRKRDNEKENTFSPRMEGRLPFQRILTMGINGVRHHRVRLFFSIILAVLSYTIFGLAMVSATADTLTTELNAAYKAGANTIILSGALTQKSKVVYDDGRRPRETESTLSSVIFTFEQQQRLEKYQAFMPVFTVEECKFDDYGHLGQEYKDLSFAKRYNPYNFYGFSLVDDLVELDPLTGETDAALTPDRRLTVKCRLPQNFLEIAITDYIADMFIRFGYMNKCGNQKIHKINGPDDLIGRELGGLTICGVYETDNDRNWFKENYDFDNEHVYDEDRYSDDIYINDIDDYIYPWMKGEHTLTYGFVCRGFRADRAGDNFAYSRVLYKLSGDIETDKSILKELECEEKRVVRLDNVNGTEYTTIVHSVNIRTGMSGFVAKVSFVNDPFIINVAINVSVGFAIFSVLFMMYYLMVGMNARKKEIGILRTLGVKKADVGLICLVESMFLSLINFIITLITMGMICFTVNLSLNMTLFIVGVVPFFTLFALCFGAAILSAIIPILKIMWHKPNSF